ncbi:MAG TPA: PhoH family protein [Burkholderiaceae bacterium]|nr:PhoH family protein [Burkholderiaceae bacterium]
MPLPPIPRRKGATLAADDFEDASTRPAPQPPTDSAADATSSTPAADTGKHATDKKTAALLKKAATAKKAAAVKKATPAARKSAAKKAIPATSAPAKKAAATKTSRPASESKTVSTGKAAASKLFVLDTNVLLHDSTAIFKFQEHDVFLPMVVLEELDHQKKGLTEVARNARQVSRFLDGLAGGPDTDLTRGLRLDSTGNAAAGGKLYFQTRALKADLPFRLPMGKADNIILEVVHAVQNVFPDRTIILVSKDINMRLKARTLGLNAEDYLSDHVIDDSDLLYDGVMPLPDNFWTRHGEDIESWQQAGTTYYHIRGPLCKTFMVNQFVYSEGDLPLYAQVKECSGKTAVLATLRDYSHGRNNVWGITARNREQNFALSLLMDHDCDFVSLLGQAGTGKTLLALAAGLTQIFETKRYNEIIITRATVSVGDDIGYLPGTEEEKMLPWMGALEDNLEVLHLGMSASHRAARLGAEASESRAATLETIRSRIKVKSLSFMRGRTFMNKFLIIDEAQNLTPKQMKTLITRAGPGTKIVCLGNIAQIDTPYLTEGSSGLTYVVDRFKGWPHAGHVTLKRGERSRLADYATDAL